MQPAIAHYYCELADMAYQKDKMSKQANFSKKRWMLIRIVPVRVYC